MFSKLNLYRETVWNKTKERVRERKRQQTSVKVTHGLLRVAVIDQLNPLPAVSDDPWICGIVAVVTVTQVTTLRGLHALLNFTDVAPSITPEDNIAI